jgi:hypothetical protein
MEEMRVLFPDYFDGTLAANVVRYVEFPVPAEFKWAKAWASNDSSATLTLAGATATSIAAQTIGDSGDPKTITPASTDVTRIAKDEKVTITLDYDGASGTAAENVHVLMCFELGVA